ncbi:MAG: hypothetical protein RLZZ59_559, partial [Pseudomonadota bacterium]
MRNNKNLKNILKASTMLAGLAFGAMEAGAVPAQRTTQNGGAAVLSTGAELDNPFVNSDEIKFGAVQDLNVDVEDANIAAIDLDDLALNGKTIVVSENATIGSIALNAGNPGTPARAIKLTLADNKTLTFSGTASSAAGGVVANNYAGLGETTLGDGSTLKITSTGADFANATINGTAPGRGTIVISDAGNTFSKAIGGAAAIAKLEVNAANTTFSEDVKTKALVLGSTGVMKIADGKTLDLVGNATGTITGAGTLTAVGDLTIQNFKAIGEAA